MNVDRLNVWTRHVAFVLVIFMFPTLSDGVVSALPCDTSEKDGSIVLNRDFFRGISM